ncbi:RING/U-box superfamily protein [Rhynchospora pubera]|uniref:RING/U-box superfamily protein n=1 Tax=Rhynchospora pubera TaxID=906938 RepID=A0AAV8FB88_9POAL|nr:RING/U-box superfamily protein [Rhynchospora pubera]
MSISPFEAQGFDPISNPIVEEENPSSNHGVAQLSPPRSGASPPQRGGAIADSRAPESPVASNGNPLNPSETVVGFSVAISGNSPAENRTNGIQPNSRRNQGVNANYLLNFSYDPINRSTTRGPRAPAPQRKPRKIKPYNKDLFLQANYRFTVLDTGSYEIASMDPDKMLQWEDIICVRHRTAVPVQCPICLEAPLCPQITSCGHIYCFPCILQYLLIGTEDLRAEIYKRCPLCFMMVSTKDLYTLVIESVKQLSVGDVVTFALLTRSKVSLFPTLKTGNVENNPVDLKDDVLSDSFAKFVLTSDVNSSVQEAMNDLTDWLHRADSGLVDDLEKLPYVCAALEQLEERRRYWNEYRNSATSLRTGTSPPLKNSFSPPKSGVQIDSSVVESCEKGLDEKEGDSYTFYQSVDGQLLILHSVNMKCLLHHYGSYDMLPSRISGKIVELETVTQSEQMRKRYRFLSHFSLTTTFQLCEIDLRGLVPPSSLSPFMEEIKNREKQRKRLAKKEERERAKAEAAAAVAAAMEGGGAPDPRHYSYSPKDVVFSLDDFEALGNSPAASTSPPTNGERKRFADVIRLGFASGHDSPSLNPESAAALSRNTNSTTNASSTIQGPTGGSTLSFANIIATARAPESHDSNRTNTNGNGTGIGKKGKKPNRVLLSTSGGRRY